MEILNGLLVKLSFDWNIIYLDLATETYGEVLQPVYDEGIKDLTLGSLREWLCVLCNYHGIRADLWVMKVYGVRDSWTKLVSIPCLTDPGTDHFSCISNDGKILLQLGSKLIVYDSKNGTFSENQNFDKCVEASTFVETYADSRKRKNSSPRKKKLVVFNMTMRVGSVRFRDKVHTSYTLEKRMKIATLGDRSIGRQCLLRLSILVRKNKAMSNLPRDFLTDILSRLPAKSLGRFKLVSKNWFSLISSADFIKLHHRRVLSDTNTNHSRVFIMSTHSLHSVNYESPSCYEGVNDDDAKAIISLNDPLEKESVGEKELGSCYGLIFFVCYNDCILLWNPTTQKTRIIPDPITPLFDGTRFYGLGYDLSIDDYKMVMATRSISSNSISCQVFNLKTDSWRTVQATHMNINEPDEIGSFSNGAIHWIVRHRPHNNGFNQRETILSFDIKDEVFMEILLPNGGENEQSAFWCLGDLKGCLYAVYGGDGVDMDVWVMKEYGVESSWSKVIKLDWFRFNCDYGMIPVCFTHEDDVVLDFDSI
ncbi:hypothetical protein L1987_04517 [Smallanthus sonchifolius]|uniref:Uncharacterized protein n=1 Tax=Smallanthus sonchifolius TaxID=185202 RepID=A0ACB9JST6_9ASTR|nr:hypothetical protein L1987_04517 [Smallanthus sonchifolius]